MNTLKKNAVTEFPKKSRYMPENAAFAHGLFDRLTLSNAKKAAIAEIEKHGLPTPKLERWQYTNFAAAYKAGFEIAMPHLAVIGSMQISTDDVKGDAPPGDDMMLWHLNTALAPKAVVIDGAGDAQIDLKGLAGTFTVPRLVIRVPPEEELVITEHHEGEGAYWQNGVTQIILGANARLRHYIVQDDAPEAFRSWNTHISLERDAAYEGFTMTTGGAISRNQFHAVLNGQNGNCFIGGVNLLRGRQHGDTAITVEHKAPHCASSQFFRTVLDDRAHGVFQGKIHVHSAAQKTDGYQLSNALLLSEGAEMDTKPELEIYADDVKCSHGATTGQIEDAPLFYLRTRGLSEAQARSLLIGAFLNEAVEKISDEKIRDDMQARTQEWLKKK